MRKIGFSAILLALALLPVPDAFTAFISWNAPEHAGKPYVLLVSIDGYRHDYTDLFKPKNLRRLREKGSSAKGLIPIFPSKTFPNHYSIITGLYAEGHGIVGNKFYAPDLKKSFSLNDRSTVEDGRFYGGLPVWSAAAKQNMVSAVHFWPGSEAEIAGFRPSRYLLYDAKTPNRERVEQVFEWLRLPEGQRPHFVCLYFSDVDKAGHVYGIKSKELREAVLRIDTEIGVLLDGVAESQLPVNVIVLSDHGMVEMDPEKTIYLDDFTQFGSASVIPYSQFALIYAENPVRRAKIYADLKAHAEKYTVYLRDEIPEELHLRHTSRIGDILVKAIPPYAISVRADEGKTKNPASHGYDPDLSPAMRGIFYAQGPQIRSGIVLEPLRNIHVYPFLLRLLGLEIPKHIDGNLDVLRPLLKEKP